MNFIKNAKNNKFSKFLLMIMIFAFILSSISGIMFMTNKYNIIAINDKKVNINEFVGILNNEKQRFYEMNKNEIDIDFLNSKEFMHLILNNLINDNLVKHELENYKIKKPDEVILSNISKEQYFYTNNKFDINKFKQVLKLYNMSEYEYIKIIKDKESSDFLISLIDNSNVNNDFISNNIFKNENKNKIVSVFSINKKLLNVKNINVSQDDVKNYYDKNKPSFNIPESRKVDFIEIKNFKNTDVEKVEELLLTSNTINDIAKEINNEIKTFGYINKDNSKKILEKYDNISEELFSYKINDFSNVKKIDKDLYIFSVVDIKKSRLQTLEEVKENIKDIIVNENKDKEYKILVSNYLENYVKNNYNRGALLKRGFNVKNVIISKNNYANYDPIFANDILNTNKNNTTKIFIDDNSVYFAYIKNDSLIDENNDLFVDLDSIKNDINLSINNNIQKEYINYLKDKKYKVIINYKLLNLIR